MAGGSQPNSKIMESGVSQAMSFIEIVVLAIIQGLTEFLPISDGSLKWKPVWLASPISHHGNKHSNRHTTRVWWMEGNKKQNTQQLLGQKLPESMATKKDLQYPQPKVSRRIWVSDILKILVCCIIICCVNLYLYWAYLHTKDLFCSWCKEAVCVTSCSCSGAFL